MGAVFRAIPSKILSLDELNLPAVHPNFCAPEPRARAGHRPDGSGKSTTLAAMVNHINETRAGHILTIEDPIEFVHESKKCLINQREVGAAHPVASPTALRAALREDPDVILVGEMRDLETIRLALTAAETGHLVFGTLHTNVAPPRRSTASSTCSRPTEKEQVRAMLSESLRGVISQTLLQDEGRPGRVAAHEIMVGTPAIRNLIREAKTFQIPSDIQTGKKDGMVQMDQSIMSFLMAGTIDAEEAYAKAMDKSLFRQYVQA